VNLDTHVEDVIRHLELEDLDDVVLVGHSYGGMVVTGVADRVPERIAEHPLAAFEQPLRLEGRGNDIPATYIRCTESDVPLESFIARARVAGWTMRELATGHDAQVFDPAGLVGLLVAE